MLSENINDNPIYLDDALLNCSRLDVSGEFVDENNEKFYRISNYNYMSDFFMTIVSSFNHWMFISSNGSLTAGRKNRDNALFPYYSVDKIHNFQGVTGNETVLIVERSGKRYLWQPFLKQNSNVYKIQRNLYKNIYGNQIIFEELNNDLGICYRYGWYTSDRFGFVKKSSIRNLSDIPLRVEVLDGIKNILPSGVSYVFQNEYSNLLDGYKKNELMQETGLGLFMLSSIPVDRAEPSESLNATTVFSYGLSDSEILISESQLQNFKKGKAVSTEYDKSACRGAYLVSAGFKLEKDEQQDWGIVAEINQSSTDAANLNHYLLTSDSISEAVEADIKKGTDALIRIAAGADALQSSNEELCSARHFSNTLFNIMRGGIYSNNYTIDKSDFIKFVKTYNKKTAAEMKHELNALPDNISNQVLLKLAYEKGDPDYIRICLEYLPLTFSRRHGDPSRPWNLFSIENKNDDGSLKLDFQGNWRDIFQNWEALSLSYPGYIDSIISKFVNASTADGYNPYRIMRDGIDWECPDPDDPWSYIGYWGDHQIIYLQKLLEISDNYYPGKLDDLLCQEIFVYANVPYRIKPYSEIIETPKDTIVFDEALNQRITARVEKMGSDGRLVMNAANQIIYVNLTEKILVSLLAKLNNFIPEAGIWLNTQRPEWNDANNALVGNGVSMVTLYYLRRFIEFWNKKFTETGIQEISISEEVNTLLECTSALFEDNQYSLAEGFSDKQRRHFADVLGAAGTDYRKVIYDKSFSGKKHTVSRKRLLNFFKITRNYIDQSIEVNKRGDGLYHSYNLLSFHKEKLSIRPLYEMLEGQVAVLSSGYLSPEESLQILDNLKNSKLFREDQYSYILYPNRKLARFMDKNIIPADRVKDSELLSRLLSDNDSSILSIDNAGKYHFNSSFRNAEVLEHALDSLDDERYGELVKAERKYIHDLLEELFDHKSFTGRSGTFYAYEGLGSIYWHMVSKLLLAVEECFYSAVEKGAESHVIGRLKEHYYEIKAGIGLYKSPELYGAFPIDPYSHTPANAGAKQPGMTGQVKEDFISRMGELGVRVRKGRIIFDTDLLNSNELLRSESRFEYYCVSGEKLMLKLGKNQLGFTICQVPVIYTAAGSRKITVKFNKSAELVFDGNAMDEKTSRMIFERTGDIKCIEVSIHNIG